MFKLLKEINGLELKSYVSSVRACSYANDYGYSLESKFGKLTLNLESSAAQQIKLHFRRVSGNGKVMIKCGETTSEFLIGSKISQCVDIALTNNTIEIIRPEDSVGEINLFGLSFCIQEDSLAKNWKNLISKCGEHSQIRMIGEKLFASEGGFIDNGNSITNLITEPPNMWTLENNRIKFLGSCEIINFEFIPGNDLVSKNTSLDLFAHRNIPTPNKLISVGDNFTNPSPSENRLPLKPKPAPIEPRNLLLYDSKTAREFAKNKPQPGANLKFINSNNHDYLLIKKGGTYYINTSFAASNSEYMVVITLKKLNGNGKLECGIVTNNQQFSHGASVVADIQMVDKHIKIKTGELPTGDMFRLAIGMSENGTGEILIEKIRIIDGMFNSVPFSLDNIAAASRIAESGYNVIDINGLLLSKKRFVIVVPSYNNIEWCDKNIASVIYQNYNDYRVIFTDDCSSDGTFERVRDIVNNSGRQDKITLIKNSQRKGALHNLYDMIHSCDDDEIIITLDGDDWLAHENVLYRLNQIYSSENIWMTYGQYQNYPDGGTGIAQLIPNKIIQNNSFREYTWCASHLRTFYAWLFKNIRKEDLMYQGKFMSMAWDLTIMFPALEMSGVHSKFINEILYVYNLSNPINDHKVDRKLQADLDRYVRRMPRYPPLLKPSIKKPISIGLLLIATHKYSRFVQGLISSADNFFLKDFNVNYYLFTDQAEINTVSRRRITTIPIDHKPFPFASMDRFQHFTNHADKFANEDYLFYVDVDCLFVDSVGPEILGSLVVTQHCGYVNMAGPWEDNPKSALYLSHNKYRLYLGGGFSGGKKDKYLEMSKWCVEKINEDVSNGIIPRHHDETAINTYAALYEPNVILNPSYHYPQSNITHYKTIWGDKEYRPKILLLDKNHAEIRN